MDISILLDKIKSGEDLSDDEYKFIIEYEDNRLDKKTLEYVENYDDDISINYVFLDILGQQIGEQVKNLSPTARYMLASIANNYANFVLGKNDKERALKFLGRYNTLNYVREIDEIFKYEELMNNLHTSIEEVINEQGIDAFSENVVGDEIIALEKSRNKIKVYRKKFF